MRPFYLIFGIMGLIGASGAAQVADAAKLPTVSEELATIISFLGKQPNLCYTLDDVSKTRACAVGDVWMSTMVTYKGEHQCHGCVLQFTVKAVAGVPMGYKADFEDSPCRADVPTNVLTSSIEDRLAAIYAVALRAYKQ